jgi:hypothetical protein
MFFRKKKEDVLIGLISARAASRLPSVILAGNRMSLVFSHGHCFPVR